MRPIQKFGSENPRIEPDMIALPASPSGLSPASMPSGMPTRIENASPTSASSSVAGSRCRMTSTAGTL